MRVERRDYTRHNVIERVTAIIGNHEAVPCIMTNIGRGGARISFPSERRLPRHFDIDFRDGKRVKVHFIWQRGATVGVEFGNGSHPEHWLVLRALLSLDS